MASVAVTAPLIFRSVDITMLMMLPIRHRSPPNDGIVAATLPTAAIDAGAMRACYDMMLMPLRVLRYALPPRTPRAMMPLTRLCLR